MECLGMFYQPRNDDHGLPSNPFKACTVPRPIAWITTLSHDGITNLAPFSCSNQLAYDPPFVFFSASGRDDETTGPRRKDSVINAENTGEFVWNMATYDLREQVRLSAAPVPPDVDELEMVGLTPAACRLVSTPRILESPINLECKHYATITLPATQPSSVHHVIIGEVVGIHIADWALKDGRVDYSAIRPIARLGYLDYTFVSNVFEMEAVGESLGMIGEPPRRGVASPD
jgi:flavin reductase (DIM6/NTAB) family NADH-FMN oxidoreductase RutF